MEQQFEEITLGAGCFWCVYAVFKRVRGVQEVLSGYSAGNTVNPTYKEVCTGETNHAEVLHIKFDPAAISVDNILRIFFAVHDPTLLNKQNDEDVGTQYRSIILYHSEVQKQTAESIIKELTEAKKYENPIVTAIEKFEKFYPAEEYHQDYYDQNTDQRYCKAVIEPKLKKFLLKHSEVLKNNSTEN